MPPEYSVAYHSLQRRKEPKYIILILAFFFYNGLEMYKYRAIGRASKPYSLKADTYTVFYLWLSSYYQYVNKKFSMIVVVVKMLQSSFLNGNMERDIDCL